MTKSNYELFSVPEIVRNVGSFGDANDANLTSINIKVYLKLLEYAMSSAEKQSESNDVVVICVSATELFRFCKESGFKVSRMAILHSLHKLDRGRVIKYNPSFGNPEFGASASTVTMYKKFFVKGKE